jgi:hypothetical protein
MKMLILQLKDQKSILNTAGTGPNLRVQFTATVAISSLVTIAVPITIQIYRGEGPGRVLVYSLKALTPLHTPINNTKMVKYDKPKHSPNISNPFM